MVIITDKAAEKAKSILSVEGKAEWGLRIYTANGGCCGPSYGLDLDEAPMAEDQVFEKNGLKVFIDRQTLITLAGVELDYVEEDDREGFVLKGGPVPSCGPGCNTGGCDCG
jgi:iron-sulfur cluster assembly protein